LTNTAGNSLLITILNQGLGGEVTPNAPISADEYEDLLLRSLTVDMNLRHGIAGLEMFSYSI
jgi:hypothetical protein